LSFGELTSAKEFTIEKEFTTEDIGEKPEEFSMEG
jgi:hypothetical protein